MGASKSKLSPEALADLTRRTHFDRKELQLWHKGFIKDCPKGTIDKKDFQKIYKQYFPFGDPSKYAAYIFRLIDTNNNGEIDFAEFVTALSVSARGDLEDRLAWSFQLYDLDEDGFISKAEMLCIVDAIYRMVGTTAGLPADELTPEQRVDKVFTTMDLDGDGRLSVQEFKDGAKRDPSILDALGLYSGLV
ncbi:Calcium-binding protein NCS-1 [Polyrhizophydium stewartii]|uniref:Calcium-binding protein NCS-1 n=1 Tax=Polyrhizophydium stewartii TaxID=2732419 RepID=A0ABR4NBM9_9FUNG|nr:Neuronal calcium sensor 1 [Polyrhizophydium stewartii]